MSNSAVGNVYQRVIQEVIDASQMDFQDSGVDPVILDQLREVWQQKLSALSVATFPWDPPPPPPAAPEPEPVKEPTPPPPPKEEEEKKIKPEPGTPPPPPPPPGQPLTDPSIAAARAAQHVQNKFGGAAMKQQPSSGPGTPASGGLMFPGKPQAPSQNQANGSGSGVGNNQTDGAGEEDGDTPGEHVVIARLDADGAIERVVAEGNLMRAQESALRAALEDLRFQSQSAVLGSPAGSSKRSARRNKRKDLEKDAAGEPSSSSSSSSSVSCAPNMQQMDGPDDDMEDEDAINSDLDDPDDDPVDDDDEAEGVVPQIMLCMYDKVQRTKNKWKCVLKDGVLTVNGKEYVFHKATGEYEW